MFKRIFAILMAFTMILSFAACNKDKKDEVEVAPQKGGSSSDTAEGNPDAWWQQYTTKPSGTTKQHKTQKVDKPKEEQAKKPNKKQDKKPTTSKAKVTTKKHPEKDPFVKVDSHTMMYDVYSSNGSKQGSVTLKNNGNDIDNATKLINSVFGTSYNSGNAVSYTSTVKANEGKTIIYIFSSTSKTASNLQFVMIINGDQLVPFFVSDDKQSALYFWPMASSGNDKYNEYLSQIKGICGNDQYVKSTETFKEIFKDPNFKEFLTW